MNLSYHVTGAERKRLVNTISQLLNAPMNYLGAPSFAYEVGGYHIDRDGALTGPQNNDLEDMLRKAGFEAESTTITIEVPLAGFTEVTLENLCKMVTAKAALLTAAIGTQELPVSRTAETVAFPWFPADSSAEQVQAYTALVTQLCETAKNKKRVSSKSKDTEGSPKYAMRCFLLSLGMVGSEFKEARKILLSKLSGSSSFCSKASEERWKAKHMGRRADIGEVLQEAGEPLKTEARE